jgi:hypothetical protein
MLHFQIQLQWLLWMPEAVLSEFSCRNLYIFCCYYPFVVQAVAAVAAAMKMISMPPWWNCKVQKASMLYDTSPRSIVSRSNDFRFFGNDDQATTDDGRDPRNGQKKTAKIKRAHILQYYTVYTRVVSTCVPPGIHNVHTSCLLSKKGPSPEHSVIVVSKCHVD